MSAQKRYYEEQAEIEIDGKLVFSKFQTKKFPDSEEIYSWFH